MADSTLTLAFPAVAGHDVVARFDGGDVTSDAGVLVLAAAEQRLGLVTALAGAVDDRRDPDQVRHPVASLLRARLLAIAQGYEDANDLDRLRTDPALKLACGQLPRTGAALASQPTVSRLENAVTARDLLRMSRALAGLVVGQLPPDTQELVIDLDPTEDPCHGQQQLECFNGFYDRHCYLPLMVYVSADDGEQQLVAAVLRPGNAGAMRGARAVLRQLVRLLRAQCAQARITVRADSGFGVEEMLSACESLGVAYVLGLPANPVLHRLSTPWQLRAAVRATYRRAGEEAWVCGRFRYQAKTWPHARWVIVKVEVTGDTLNPRFVVADREDLTPAATYTYYCARGDAENRIKELKLDLASGRTSCHRFLANQCRLLLHAAAYVLWQWLRARLAGTGWAQAQIGTLRTRLLKVGARVVETCRKVWVHLPTSCPVQDVWARLHQALC